MSIGLTRCQLGFAAAAWMMLVANGFPAEPAAPDAQLRDSVAAGLKKAARFFVTDVATEGGYLWQYSADLARREGEREASATTVWVQPPGTPAVGVALLRAWEATGASRRGSPADRSRQEGR